MTNCIYIRYEPLECLLRLINKLKAPKTGFDIQHEIRIFVARNQNLMLLQTHLALAPAIVSASLEIDNQLTADMDITVSAKPFLKCVNAIGSPTFVKITVDGGMLRIQAAMSGGELFGEDKYMVIETTDKHHVKLQPTQLITDYKISVVDQKQIFRIRKSQSELIKRITAFAKTSKKHKEVQVMIVSNASVLRIELLAPDIYAHLQLLEHDSECDANIRLDLDQLIFLKAAMAIAVNSDLGPVEMAVGEQSSLILSCQNIMCEITQRSDVVPRTPPIMVLAKKSWCEEPNLKLQNGLKKIVVMTRPAEDIVEIQMHNSQIHGLQSTDYASGSFHIDSKAGNSAVDGPAIIVNREQLDLALKCFNSYEILKIHGLLSRENHFVIKPSSNSDEIAVLSITDTVKG
jgi:hypothetical protein